MSFIWVAEWGVGIQIFGTLTSRNLFLVQTVTAQQPAACFLIRSEGEDGRESLFSRGVKLLCITWGYFSKMDTQGEAEHSLIQSQLQPSLTIDGVGCTQCWEIPSMQGVLHQKSVKLTWMPRGTFLRVTKSDEKLDVNDTCLHPCPGEAPTPWLTRSIPSRRCTSPCLSNPSPSDVERKRKGTHCHVAFLRSPPSSVLFSRERGQSVARCVCVCVHTHWNSHVWWLAQHLHRLKNGKFFSPQDTGGLVYLTLKRRGPQTFSCEGHITFPFSDGGRGQFVTEKVWRSQECLNVKTYCFPESHTEPNINNPFWDLT